MSKHSYLNSLTLGKSGSQICIDSLAFLMYVSDLRVRAAEYWLRGESAYYDGRIRVL